MTSLIMTQKCFFSSLVVTNINVLWIRNWRMLLHVMHVHSPGGSTSARNDVILSRCLMSWPASWKYDMVSEIRLNQLRNFYSRNYLAKFLPDLIWNDRALRCFWRGHSNKKSKKKNRKMSSDVESIPAVPD